MSICVFGIFVADLCFFANDIPIPGQTILGKKYIIGPGGKGSNQAIAAARAGGNVSFISKVGKDKASKWSSFVCCYYGKCLFGFIIKFKPFNR